MKEPAGDYTETRNVSQSAFLWGSRSALYTLRILFLFRRNGRQKMCLKFIITSYESTRSM